MSEATDLRVQIDKRLEEARGDADITMTGAGVFHPDSYADVFTRLALYERLFAALVDIVNTLAAEIDRLKSQDRISLSERGSRDLELAEHRWISLWAQERSPVHGTCKATGPAK
jgi:hypothetical protein